MLETGNAFQGAASLPTSWDDASLMARSLSEAQTLHDRKHDALAAGAIEREELFERDMFFLREHFTQQTPRPEKTDTYCGLQESELHRSLL